MVKQGKIADLQKCRELESISLTRRYDRQGCGRGGRAIKERKEILAMAEEKVLEKVRNEKWVRYKDLVTVVRNATMQILARTTTKHKDKDNKEIWTAPTMVTVEDPETR
jgi:hypothetical protein